MIYAIFKNLTQDRFFSVKTRIQHCGSDSVCFFPLIGLFLCGEELTRMVSKAQLLDLTMEFSKNYLYNYNITCSTNLTMTLNH